MRTVAEECDVGYFGLVLQFQTIDRWSRLIPIHFGKEVKAKKSQ